MAQAVIRSPHTAGVPNSRPGHSMWVSWWTKWNLGRFFLGFLPFSPITNFIPPFLHTYLIRFVSFHQLQWWCNRRGQPASLLFTDLDPALSRTWVEGIYLQTLEPKTVKCQTAPDEENLRYDIQYTIFVNIKEKPGFWLPIALFWDTGTKTEHTNCPGKLRVSGSPRLVNMIWIQ